ncbi:MAG: ABC transporter substrate-binding protein [Burkholderiales bacterium]|nr:ABC transporter substrate-binding protein [Burkholderiales bacterium]MDE2394853.1 ABC transporter substrate-binding protein [Burkholderiales bacterium]MDE2452269.1 ABC transporter substrate-binding protein [Burkholderiales bacterium]
MNPLLKRLGLAALLAFAAFAASAQTRIVVGGLRTIALLPVSYAIEKGYFKREGLDVELQTVNSGPAVISALMSDSVQIGYSASLPVLFARAQKLPVRIFTAFDYETSKPDGAWTWLVASQRSGVKTVKELAGKTVALNASGALCELMVREHLAKAGVAWDSVKKIVVPFPQMPAALQLGNADAACIIEPFRTQARVSPAIKATTLAAGALADGSPRWALDVLFTREDWGRAHKDELRRFNKGLVAALDDFRKQPGLYRQQIVDAFKLGPAVVSLMKSDLTYASDIVPQASDIEPLIEGLARHGLLPAPMKAEDLILKLN